MIKLAIFCVHMGFSAVLWETTLGKFYIGWREGNTTLEVTKNRVSEEQFFVTLRNLNSDQKVKCYQMSSSDPEVSYTPLTF